MKKFCAILFSFVLVLMLALPVAAEDAAGESDSLFDTAPALTAPAGYVVNLDTNIVVYEKNSETQLSAASLTKMMTTLLLLENYQDQLDSISLTAPSYIYDLIWEQSTNASTADIRRGETQSLRNLLYAMLLPSGNEAAYIESVPRRLGRLHGRRQHRQLRRHDERRGEGRGLHRHNVCRSLRAEPQQHHDGAGRLSHPARPDGLRCVRHGHRHPQLRHGHK